MRSPRFGARSSPHAAWARFLSRDPVRRAGYALDHARSSGSKPIPGPEKRAQASPDGVLAGKAATERGRDRRGGAPRAGGGGEEPTRGTRGNSRASSSEPMAVARPVGVLVSATVMDLVDGSDLAFEDAAAHELKGLHGTRQLYRST